MLKNLSIKIARFLAPDYFRDADRRVEEAEYSANRRYAKLVTDIDPFELVMRTYHGVFSVEYEHPEDRLNDNGKLQMKMWGYNQIGDPSFKYLVEWIQNTQGNATIKKGNPTPETILYGRAQLSMMIFYVREVRRLAGLYEEILKAGKEDDFDSVLAVE